METCPYCGWHNERSAQWCARCKRFLFREEADPAGAGAPPRAPITPGSTPAETDDPPLVTGAEAPPGFQYVPSGERTVRVMRVREQGTPVADAQESARSADGARGVHVTLQFADLAVEPGATATARITISNTGTIIERANVEVRGLPKDWTVTIDPPAVNLDVAPAPDADRPVAIRLRPPRRPETKPVPYPFDIVVWSSLDPNVRSVQTRSITVKGFAEPAVGDLTAALAGWFAQRRRATFHFDVHNQGNVELKATAVGVPGGDGLAVRCHPSRLSIPPGGTSTVAVHVVAAKAVLSGASVDHSFAVNVTGGAERTVRATYTQPAFVSAGIRRALAVVLVALVVVAGLMGRSAWVNRARAVPSVVSLRLPDGRTTLQRKGFAVRVTEAVGRAEEKDTIVSQDPAPGQKRRPSTAVHLVVSAGPARFELPDVRTRSEAEAKAELESRRLVVDVERRSDPEAPQGSVITQDPAPRTTVAVGDTVKLGVSTGRPVVTVPSLVNLSISDAIAVLDRAKLRLGEVQVAADDRSANRIVRQDPSPASMVAEGTEIRVAVGALGNP